jgi:SPP1 family predicted phage head-tail adaptor
MMWKDVINLMAIVYTKNSIGDITETTTSRQVFCDVRSIRQSEFYQAAAVGVKPEIVFMIRHIDYSNEKKLSYNNIEYNIIRTFTKNGEILELVCDKLAVSG